MSLDLKKKLEIMNNEGIPDLSLTKVMLPFWIGIHTMQGSIGLQEEKD